MRHRPLAFLALVAGLMAAVAVSRGSGPPAARAQMPPETPVPAVGPPRPVPPPPPPVTLDRMEVGVEVTDDTASTTLDLTFKNASDRPQEATLLFPVPADAAISDFTMTVDGVTIEGELLGGAEAARIYTGIVQRQRDPALLEFAGAGLLRARVFPVPPRGESRLTLRLSQFVSRENGAVRYRLPLSTGTDIGPKLPLLTITARVTSAHGVRSLFSPTHAMRFTRESDTVMAATYEERDAVPRGAFELNVLLSDDPLGAGLISYKAPGEDGFFMLWLAPPLQEEAVVDKDVIVVLDRSGSMAGPKIDQAKAALRFVLNRLNPGDRFDVIDFSSSVTSFAPSLRSTADVGNAIGYVNALRAEGGTNIDEALREAMRLVDIERLTTILFLTDGQPTVGETSATRILDNVRGAAPANARLFVFGVGDDVNTLLLDGLAVQNHGDVTYVRPNEDVEESVSTLYNRISSPQLTDLRIDYGDARAYDAYPQPLPDLFGGQTLFVTGRYRTSGPVTLHLSGTTIDGPGTFTFEGIELAANDRRASYLPRLWASRKIGSLLREIRLRGPQVSKELIDEVTALGTRYGIVTPFTSFLVQEPAQRAPTAAPVAGAPAVAAAATAADLAKATPAPQRTATATPAPGQPTVMPAPGQAPGATFELRYVGDKTFLLKDGVWVDTLFQPDTETQKVQFASEAYFALLAQFPDLAPYFALGERVIVVYNGAAFEVTE